MLTDAEAAAVSALRNDPNVPQAEREQANWQWLNHYADQSVAKNMVQFLPSPGLATTRYMQEIEKARINQIGNSSGSPSARGTATGDSWNEFELPGIRAKRLKMAGRFARAQAQANPFISGIIGRQQSRALNYVDPVEPGLTAILTQAQGFDVVIKGRAATAKLSREEELEKQYITNFIQYSGDVGAYNGGDKTYVDHGRSPFASMVEAYTKDRFTIAELATERQWSRRGSSLRGVFVADADTIYHTIPSTERGFKEAVGGGRNRYAQVMNRRFLRSYTPDEIVYDVANMSSEQGSNGYGRSEVEECYLLTQALLNVITSNSSYYDRNAMPEGLLALTGNLTASEGLLSLEQEMRSRTQDPGGNHGLMFVSFADPQAKIQYHPIRNVPKDMVNSQFASLDLALTATRFGEDLGGLNMAMFGGSASNLGGGTSAGIRADEAKSTSFLPWMAQLCRSLNNVYAPILGTKWRVIWRGHERVDEAMFDLWKSVASMNEIRGFLALEDRDDIVGEMPANNAALSQLALAAFKDGVDLKTGKVTTPPDAAPAKKKPAPKTGKANPKARGKIRIRKSF